LTPKFARDFVHRSATVAAPVRSALNSPHASAAPTVKLSAVIMSHPRRESIARSLSRALGDVPIVFDTSSGRSSPLRGSLSAWRSAESTASHHLVIQDDVLPSRDLIGQFERAIAAYPNAILSGYANWDSRAGSATRMAAACGATWVETVTEFYFSSVATVIPTIYLDEFIEYSSRFIGILKHDDLPLSQFIAERGILGLVAVPALVEHRGLPSIAGNNSHGTMRAACFIGDATSEVRAQDRLAQGYELCPHFEAGRVDCWARVSVRGRDRWARVPWTDVAPELGLDSAEMRSRFSRAFGGQTAIAKDIDGEYVFGIWALAHILGMLVRRSLIPVTSHPPSDSAQRFDPAVVRMALSTLGTGAARFTTVHPSDLERHQGSLADLVVEAYNWALEDGNA
jgi:hypothetical protein